MTSDATDETRIETTDTSRTITRTFDVPRERVYRAFVEPNELERWYAPGDVVTQVHALEPKPDGAFSMSFGTGEDCTEIHGTFVEVVAEERIVHAWNYPSEEESRVTYEFRDADGGTEGVLTHEEISTYRNLSEDENVDGYVDGWSSALEKLDAALGG